MKAVVLEGYGGVDQLAYRDVPRPEPKQGEVLVKVAATSVNPVDWKLRRGDLKTIMPLELPAILGRDVAGTVESTGSGVSGFDRGDRVMGLVNQAYAEYLVANADTLTRIPDGLDTLTAAALPLVVLTGSQLIESGVKPRPGQTVLVTGAVGSVGRSAVHAARQLGAKVIAGVRASQVEEAKKLNADRVIAIDAPDAASNIGQVDAIADTVDHEVITRLAGCIRPGGVLASVLGVPEGVDGTRLKVVSVMAHPDAPRLHKLAQDVARGEFTIPISERMKLSEAGEAQRRAESGGLSKILLIP